MVVNSSEQRRCAAVPRTFRSRHLCKVHIFSSARPPPLPQPPASAYMIAPPLGADAPVRRRAEIGDSVTVPNCIESIVSRTMSSSRGSRLIHDACSVAQAGHMQVRGPGGKHSPIECKQQQTWQRRAHTCSPPPPRTVDKPQACSISRSVIAAPLHRHATYRCRCKCVVLAASTLRRSACSRDEHAP